MESMWDMCETFTTHSNSKICYLRLWDKPSSYPSLVFVDQLTIRFCLHSHLRDFFDASNDADRSQPRVYPETNTERAERAPSQSLSFRDQWNLDPICNYGARSNNTQSSILLTDFEQQETAAIHRVAAEASSGEVTTRRRLLIKYI